MTGQREIDVVLSSEGFSFEGVPFDLGADLFERLVQPALMQVNEQLPHARFAELWAGFFANTTAMAVSSLSKEQLLEILDTLSCHLRDQPASEFGPKSQEDRHVGP